MFTARYQNLSLRKQNTLRVSVHLFQTQRDTFIYDKKRA